MTLCDAGSGAFQRYFSKRLKQAVPIWYQPKVHVYSLWVRTQIRYELLFLIQLQASIVLVLSTCFEYKSSLSTQYWFLQAIHVALSH